MNKSAHPTIRITPNQCRLLLLIKDGPRFTLGVQTPADERALRALITKDWVRVSVGQYVYTLTQLGLGAAALAQQARSR